ncbi:MAG: alpha/beta fold hydrolase [Candidatus Sericytochromatia bacterium]|nr:alpha/beta fold hydrolase [Candidatus Tanganyikabacteria bacterium]
MPEALRALTSSDRVSVEAHAGWEFRPAGARPIAAGLVLYPGAHVDPRAYAPAARALAEAGWFVALPAMPLGLAFLDLSAADRVRTRHPDVAAWAVGGHSLGGVAAARYAAGRPQRVSGLVLWAAYPDPGIDLSRASLAGLTVFATRDGRTRPEDVAKSAHRLPAGTRQVAIAGGNHAQFGWYGDQEGDLPATISREEQQRQVIAATAAFLSSLSASKP